MNIRNKSRAFLLAVGDILCFVVALWLTLLLRYREWPDQELFFGHLGPFSFIFLLWLLVFFISDLYHRPTSLFQSRLPGRIFNAQLVNTILAITFFYLIPYFGITPKINLFIDLAFTFVLVFLWRRFLAARLYRSRRERVLFLCSGASVNELKEELGKNRDYNIEIVPEADLKDLRTHGISLVVINPFDEHFSGLMPDLYPLIFAGVRFANVQKLYEEIFQRIPVSLITEKWFIENISNQPKSLYDLWRRLVDIVVSSVFGFISLAIYPFVWLAIKLDDGGPIFYREERVGYNGQVFRIKKFRSMADGKVTRVGKFLRASRIDELPQLWSVVSGDLSLIGPRPERPDYVEVYRQEIPFYGARHLISPGLSGWAQIYHDNHPHFEVATEATNEKLSYDLFYVKNRNLWLDLEIALKTLRTLLSYAGK